MQNKLIRSVTSCMIALLLVVNLLPAAAYAQEPGTVAEESCGGSGEIEEKAIDEVTDEATAQAAETGIAGEQTESQSAEEAEIGDEQPDEDLTMTEGGLSDENLTGNPEEEELPDEELEERDLQDKVEDSGPLITYSGHQQTKGDLAQVSDGVMLGSIGQSKRLEAVSIQKGTALEEVAGSIRYRVHVQSYGTQGWVADGQLAGTTGKAKRLEAIQIVLTGDLADQYDVYYRTHIQSYGWLQWTKGTESASGWSGSAGLAKRMEAIQIVLVPKGETGPDNKDAQSSYGYVTKDVGKTIIYNGHQQTYGNLSDKADGAALGTIGQSKRLEALTIRKGQNLADVDGSIVYRAHIQGVGTSGWKSDGQMVGTTGQAKRLEAIQVYLTGELAEKYDVYYTVHVQKFGWMKWTLGTADASGWCGTSGLSLRVEAVKIRLVEKGAAAPGGDGKWSYVTKENFGSVVYGGTQETDEELASVSDGATLGTAGSSKRLESVRISLKNNSSNPITGSIQYRSQVQSIGWQDWVSDGALSGTSGESKRLEAIQIKLTGDLGQYCDVWYRTYVQNYGWLGWAKNGQSAGTEGLSCRMEALQVKLVPKGSTAPGSNSGYFINMTPEEARIYQSVQSVYNQVGRDLYACYNWVVKNMTYQRINGHLTPPSGYTRCQWYAVKAFETHQGNCYCYAAAFYYLAKYLGYDAEYVEGQVTRRGGGYTPHGWVVIDGAYICDPEAQAEISPSLNFYMQPMGKTLLSYVR